MRVLFFKVRRSPKEKNRVVLLFNEVISRNEVLCNPFLQIHEHFLTSFCKNMIRTHRMLVSHLRNLWPRTFEFNIGYKRKCAHETTTMPQKPRNNILCVLLIHFDSIEFLVHVEVFAYGGQVKTYILWVPNLVLISPIDGSLLGK